LVSLLLGGNIQQTMCGILINLKLHKTSTLTVGAFEGDTLGLLEGDRLGV